MAAATLLSASFFWGIPAVFSSSLELVLEMSPRSTSLVLLGPAICAEMLTQRPSFQVQSLPALAQLHDHHPV
ncbi:uncharacterized protein B0I36DRAFT_335035 [Microdochium trichocladiopsis]|uniref:Secreted protein n=1 Tax=Microdochium trichocladiopsis TaxID=1682393 RepID=A0A9P9BKX3_9PEZI|nr:uncharacterized protein B0I36DRAFT_335035 [Microdochium trichocladiopsis]KAH7021656.1 hypothetical protein B0I36DRAFT_335035 [Microdochium trichocladiopsis]